MILPDLSSNKYGTRGDGTNKGFGYFGELKRPDGGFSTELTMDDHPLLVPTLTKEEVKYLVSGGEPTEQIISKALAWHLNRKSQGITSYARPGEAKLL